MTAIGEIQSHTKKKSASCTPFFRTSNRIYLQTWLSTSRKSITNQICICMKTYSAKLFVIGEIGIKKSFIVIKIWSPKRF